MPRVADMVCQESPAAPQDLHWMLAETVGAAGKLEDLDGSWRLVSHSSLKVYRTLTLIGSVSICVIIGDVSKVTGSKHQSSLPLRYQSSPTIRCITYWVLLLSAARPRKPCQAWHYINDVPHKHMTQVALRTGSCCCQLPDHASPVKCMSLHPFCAPQAHDMNACEQAVPMEYKWVEFMRHVFIQSLGISMRSSWPCLQTFISIITSECSSSLPEP